MNERPSSPLPVGPHEGSQVLSGKLERRIDRPRVEWTIDDLVQVFRDLELRLVVLMHVGGDGLLKVLDFIPRDELHLRNILGWGERADGSSIFRDMGIPAERSDILLRPRLETAFIDPFSNLPTLALLCRHAGRDGEPLPESPATIVEAAARRLRDETGIELHALGEVEYFLGRAPAEGEPPAGDDRGYHATAPYVYGQALRREALGILAELGVAVKYGHSEVGFMSATDADRRIWEQHEIELRLAPLPEAADGVVLTRWVLGNLALRQGMLCSFDPIIREGHAGSGLHFHMSPILDGEHQGRRSADHELKPAAQWLIGGLVRCGDALMAFGNRQSGSFVRLIQGKEAPNSVSWGEFDRHALVRLPMVITTEQGEAVTPPTIEFRLPDGSAHPHLLLAGVAQAMLHGRDTEDLPLLLAQTSSSGERRRARTVGSGAGVPADFEEVAQALRSKRAVFEAGGVFPRHLLDRVLQDMLLLAQRRP